VGLCACVLWEAAAGWAGGCGEPAWRLSGGAVGPGWVAVGPVCTSSHRLPAHTLPSATLTALFRHALSPPDPQREAEEQGRAGAAEEG
jgi:hypothetical protein